MPPSPFADKLIIETPELISIEYSLAGVGSRFLALAIDTLLQVGLVLIVLVIPISASGLEFSSLLSWSWIAGVVLLALFVIQYGYFALFEALLKGQTPGKRWMRLRVIKDSGRPLNPVDAITRNLVRIVDQLPGIYAVGIVSAMISKQSKRLGDFAAGTVVVYERPVDPGAAERSGSGERQAPAEVMLAAARLTTDEARLIASFMSRRAQLDAGVRYDAAREIARRLARSLDLPEAAWAEPEQFLEFLEQGRRRSAGYG